MIKKIYLQIWIPNASSNFPKIWEGTNTYFPFIELIESEYQWTNRYSNYTKFRWILAYRWKTENKLFVNSHKYSQFLCQHCILPYLFANTLFKRHSICSGFTKSCYENYKLFIWMLKNSVKINNYLSNLWTNISGIKSIVYQAKKFSICSLFVLIPFEIDK